MRIEPLLSWQVGVLVDCRKPVTAWGEDIWQAVTVLPGVPDVVPWTEVETGPHFTRYYAGSAPLELFRSETPTYKYNLESQPPAVYTVLRKVDARPGWKLLMATVCPGEAHAHADTGDDLVEALAMPEPIRIWLAEFVALHHIEPAFFKRKRDRANPEALARRTHHSDEDEMS